jgi:exodeoxyribonuclease VII large subunit
MKDLTNEKPFISLSKLNSLIKSAIMDALPEMYWVVAEIADIRQNQKGHCYLELIEKEDNSTIAQIRGTIWVYEYRGISSRFRKATNESLRQGMKILFLASITFHEVYGLSLNVRDIDPVYTMGEMARKKKEVIDRLRKEGLMDRNKSLELPLVPQKIAVISSPTAAGYEDFFSHLDGNPYGYRFVHTLFPALMQGREAEASVIAALNSIRKQQSNFDLVVIIRGGGSVIDLNCFDGYPLSKEVAAFPLPVITGIGHEKDDTVVDMTAHTKLKTPTAVAGFLVSGVRSFEECLLSLERKLVTHGGLFLKNERIRLTSLAQRLSLVPIQVTMLHRNRLLTLHRDMKGLLRQRFQREKDRFSSTELALRHLDPENILKRGFSITLHKGKIVKNAVLLKKGMSIDTRLHNGTITSTVQSGKETGDNGKKQGNDLLPGFE